MRYFKLYTIFLAVAMMVSACSFSEQTFFEQETIPETTAAIVTEPAEPTPAPTEVPIEPTEPDLSLHIEPGSYLLRFAIENSPDYLDYYLFIPKNAVIDMPLVIFLHGDGEIGKPEALENYSMIAQARIIYGDEFPFIAISPCTRTNSWIAGSIPQTLKSLIDATVSEYSIDTDRIIITGHSRGATGVWHMISTFGDYFSAAVPISCPYEGSINIENCAKVPTRAFAGSIGEFEWFCQEYMQRTINQMNQISDTSKFTVLQSADHSETKDEAFSEETFEWMLAQRKE